MAGKFGGYDDDEDDVLAPKEPQVTSMVPEERKEARTLRIKRRREALKKADQPAEEAHADEEPTLIEKATAAAAEELQRLSLDGAAKVTNVKVTTDEREVLRRALFSKNIKNSVQKIEEEILEAQIEYEAISNNWDYMLSIKDPLDIDAEMKAQKQKCDELLSRKDRLIDHIRNDLKTMDREYYKDLHKQDNDIKELSERIEKQITIMQRAYEKQLSLIEQAINIERESMVDHNNKRWEGLYRQRDKEEVAHMEAKFEQLEEYKQKCEEIMWDHYEKYRDAKIELETLIQELQKELEKLKAICVINTEKIGYNYQVLKKREEENVFVRSQQKRKLNKMSDIANNLRSKIRKAAEDGAAEEMKADLEIVKLMQAMDDLEKKSQHFSHVNNYKFSQVWKMAGYQCMELCNDLRKAEVALHAHILAEPPPPPPPPPPKSPLAKLEHEAQAFKPKSIPNYKECVEVNDMVAKEAKDKLVRHILQLVADNTGFLVEDRLLKLIEKYQLTSRNLCTLDSIFMALEIQAEDDVELLCHTFLNYAFCPICVGMEVTSEVIDGSTIVVASQDDIPSPYPSFIVKGAKGAAAGSSMRGRPSIVRSTSASTSRSAHVGFRSGHDLTPSDQLLMAEADEIMQKCGDPKDADIHHQPALDGGASTTGRRVGRGVTVSSQPMLVAASVPSLFLCQLGHHLEIEPMQVLTALGDFISVFVPPEKKKLYDIWDNLKTPDFTSVSRKLSLEEMEQYWAAWKNIFPPEKDRFWDGLLTGLKNYLPILQERERLHDEVVMLRRRNAGLRRLLRGALPELPPAPPRYTRPFPAAFTAPCPDDGPSAFARLPPI